jgi:hypothetical protein
MQNIIYKKIYLQGDFAAGIYLSEAQNPITPPPPLHTTHCIRVSSKLIHTGRGGGERLNQREGAKGNSSQSWVENTYMTDCISSL